MTEAERLAVEIEQLLPRLRDIGNPNRADHWNAYCQGVGALARAAQLLRSTGLLNQAGSGAGNSERANDGQRDATVPPTAPPPEAVEGVLGTVQADGCTVLADVRNWRDCPLPIGARVRVERLPEEEGQ